MNFVEERILKDGVVRSCTDLNVRGFLRNQLDTNLIEQIGREFKARFGDKTVTKVMTLESAGIAIAYAVAKEFGVPLVIARKNRAVDESNDYVAEITDHAGRVISRVSIDKAFLAPQVIDGSLQMLHWLRPRFRFFSTRAGQWLRSISCSRPYIFIRLGMAAGWCSLRFHSVQSTKASALVVDSSCTAARLVTGNWVPTAR